MALSYTVIFTFTDGTTQVHQNVPEAQLTTWEDKALWTTYPTLKSIQINLN